MERALIAASGEARARAARKSLLAGAIGSLVWLAPPTVFGVLAVALAGYPSDSWDLWVAVSFYWGFAGLAVVPIFVTVYGMRAGSRVLVAIGCGFIVLCLYAALSFAALLGLVAISEAVNSAFTDWN